MKPMRRLVALCPSRWWCVSAVGMVAALAACSPPHTTNEPPADATEVVARGPDPTEKTAKQIDHFLAETPLLTKVGPDLASQYRQAKAKTEEANGIRALLANEATHGGGDHAQKVARLKSMLDAGRKSEQLVQDRLVASAQQRSRRVSARERATLGPFLSNLRHAAEEARHQRRVDCPR
jgi:hypothetical protein